MHSKDLLALTGSLQRNNEQPQEDTIGPKQGSHDKVYNKKGQSQEAGSKNLNLDCKSCNVSSQKGNKTGRHAASSNVNFYMLNGVPDLSQLLLAAGQTKQSAVLASFTSQTCLR